MSTVVVPFRGTDPKRRLDPLPERDRRELASAMLADVLAAASAVGEVVVVAPEEPRAEVAFTHVPDPRRGQGAAVREALDAAVAAGLGGPYLVVNADLPCATPRDLLALAGAVPPDGIALAAASDGTTNALALARADLFEPVYGPGSADRFAGLAPSLRVDAPNLVDDVDVPDDLRRLRDRLGAHTTAAVAALRLAA
jgi:2-phospho-L-lactate guanylyltransferase